MRVVSYLGWVTLVTYDLSEENGITHLRLEFDIEHIHGKELQRKGWTEHVDNLESLLSL